MLSSGPDKWLLRFPTSDRPVARLVCLAGAGGSAPIFHAWAEALAPDVEVCGVVPPGRGQRFSEPPLTRMEPYADALAEVLCDGGRMPLVLFGHSLGSLIAYEVARRLQDRADVDLVGVVMAAHTAPGHSTTGFDSRSAGDDRLLQFIREAGGTPVELLDDPTVRRMVIAALRADFLLEAEYRPARRDQLSVALQVHGGRDDPQVLPSHLATWQEFAGGEFDLRLHPGGHFFFAEDGAAPLLASIRSLLTRQATAEGRPGAMP
ncbi:thioesterase II family protein [Mangrovihabitans endophyticus]|uniref:Oleoyl-ACP hydrolase n=1 Tax=Mangrovihabitans endophyticus TaxID=1751298 RepID=A0A8J3BU96_9ACTN|nr:alpha/beta fold hydrolase [Mangrovihabitans endophyticus]GGK79032.1 oleoyl-ACP hydrolase [Mangrovihabitans endophyticus]